MLQRNIYTKLSSKFQIKDKAKQEHKYDLTYNVKRLQCSGDYAGEIDIRMCGRNYDHGEKDRKSHMLNRS